MDLTLFKAFSEEEKLNIIDILTDELREQGCTTLTFETGTGNLEFLDHTTKKSWKRNIQDPYVSKLYSVSLGVIEAGDPPDIRVNGCNQKDVKVTKKLPSLRLLPLSEGYWLHRTRCNTTNGGIEIPATQWTLYVQSKLRLDILFEGTSETALREKIGFPVGLALPVDQNPHDPADPEYIFSENLSETGERSAEEYFNSQIEDSLRDPHSG